MVTPRPLDPLRSIKAKLGVLVAVTVAVSSFFVWYGLVHLDWRPRYTLPVAVLLALAPLYWMLVVGSNSSSAVSQFPPVFTPGGNFPKNFITCCRSNHTLFFSAGFLRR